MFKRFRSAAFAAGVLAAIAASAPPRAQAQTIRVEAESYVLPNGLATMGSGPNATAVTTQDVNSTASGGFIIGYFGAWDWVEYNVTAPVDGLYNLSFKYADADITIDPLPVTLTFLTTGKQFHIGNIHTTPSWAFTDYTTISAQPDDASPPLSIPLKAGVNRFRVAIRPDFTFAGAMNVDYYEFTKTTDAFPAYQTITGQVSATVGGVVTPLAGAMISEGTDYHTATNVTRTDANGAYTLYVPAGSHSLTAFANGFAPSTASVSAPGTQAFNLTANNKYEAELLDATNTGPEPDKGAQPAYDTQHSLSNNGEIVSLKPGIYAQYQNVYAQAAGAYDLSIHYSCLANPLGSVGDPGYLTWTVNTTSTVKMTYTATSVTDYLTYADSTPTVISLKKGVNVLRFTDANAGTGGNANTPAANIDYFTVAPSASPHGFLNITVTDLTSKPIGGASVTVPQGAPLYTGVTASDGTLSIPVPPGTYSVTANKSGAASAVTAPAVTVADGQTVPVNIQLTISGAAVEAEAYTAGGPGVPPVTITDLASASGGKVVSGFTGAYLQSWLQWTVNVSADGLYRLTLSYSVPAATDTSHPSLPIDMTVNVLPSNFHAHATNIPDTGSADIYGSYDLQDATAAAILVPLKAGDNTIKLSLASGTMNLDYIQVTKLQSDTNTYRTITGTVYGSDGVGSAPVAGATVWATDQLETDIPAPYHTTYGNAKFATTTDATGHFLIAAFNRTAFLNAAANGFVFSNVSGKPYLTVSGSTPTGNMQLNVNPPTSPETGTMQFDAFRLSSASPYLQTNENMITFTQPGAFFAFPISVPRAGLYQVGMQYSSGWNSGDGLPVKTKWTVNGSPQEVDFQKTSSWVDFTFAPSIATIPLNAGGNTVRVDFSDGGANIVNFTLLRTGPLPSTDINGNGKTDIIDAVIYVRGINGLDPGTKPDLNGDGLSNAADIIKILRVAGGLS